jgi:Holliday junction resolvasome RuvABC endonuclease subunit
MSAPSRLLLRRRPAVANHVPESPRPVILGIDPSLGSTGYAWIDAGELRTGLITTDKLRGPHRLFYVRMQVEKLIEKVQPTFVVFEDYAYGKGGPRNNNVFNIGELGGVVKTLLWERGVDILTISPTSLKSVIALNGSAKKPEISKALRERFDIDVKQNDMADAVGLLLIGEMKAGLRPEPPKERKSDRFAAVRETEFIKGKPQGVRR